MSWLKSMADWATREHEYNGRLSKQDLALVWFVTIFTIAAALGIVVGATQ